MCPSCQAPSKCSPSFIKRSIDYTVQVIYAADKKLPAGCRTEKVSMSLPELSTVWRSGKTKNAKIVVRLIYPWCGNCYQRCFNSLLFKKPEMPQKCEKKPPFAYTFVHETVTEKTWIQVKTWRVTSLKNTDLFPLYTPLVDLHCAYGSRDIAILVMLKTIKYRWS